MTKGVVIGAADLKPSSQARFEKVSKTLKPAPTVDAPPSPDRSAEPAATTTTTTNTTNTTTDASGAPTVDN